MAQGLAAGLNWLLLGLQLKDCEERADSALETMMGLLKRHVGKRSVWTNMDLMDPLAHR